MATVATVAYILFLRPSGDTEAMSGATAVGVPNGPATTKSIGPAGGSIASPDGRIVVDVPPNALPGPVDFSIQPITNLAHGGRGNAYRLEPGGHNFATAVKVSFKYDAQDLKGTFPEALAVAYQDTAGVWQAFKTAHIDQASKTLTVSTTHFTDYSEVTYHLSPEKATLRVGETQYISLVGCRDEGNLLHWGRRLFGRGIQNPCFSSSVSRPTWSANLGTIVPAGTGAMYTAPAKKPSPNVATVYLTYTYISDDSGGHAIGVFTSEITIVDRGYRATGQDGPTSYSGKVCSLDKPFTVTGHNGPLTYTDTFAPSGDGRTGGASLYGVYYGGTWTGGGPYKIEGFDSDKPRIVWKVTTTVSGAPGSASGVGIATIYLVPLEPDSPECNKP